MLALVGIALLMLGGIDAVLELFGASIMAPRWSPLLLIVLGLLFVALENEPRRSDGF